MISLTKEERSVLAFFVFVLTVGSGLSYTFKKYPQLKSSVQFIEANRPHRKVNVNKASYEKLVAIPYIGPYTATKIIECRPFSSLDQIKAIDGIGSKNFEIFSKYLTLN
ncbi:MAG TPA: helix-hairpin-helix domain-containing protein [Candidatus Omnitrophota bacterium]|nr:helix-hairpin-helix domain-containing protein [Candidatus Omnitrophota bacterium]